MVEDRVAQGPSSFVHATMNFVVGERAVEADLSRGVRTKAEFVNVQIATSTKDFIGETAVVP